MIKQKDIVDHVAAVSGIKKADVRAVLDEAFGYLRDQVLQGNDAHHPRLGKIKVRQRTTEDGVAKGPVYRFIPQEPGSGAGTGQKAETEA